MGYIYKITNQINGKMYIGKTEHLDPNRRWKEHTRQCVLNEYRKRPLYYAMNKYGINNFTFDIIEEVENGDTLCEREKYYIDKYRTYVGFNDCNGYNSTLGGDGRSYIDIEESQVIKLYLNKKSISSVAEDFQVSYSTIEKILDKNNVYMEPSKSSDDYYMYKYGGIIMMDYNGYSIIDILESPKKFEEKYGLNADGIKDALYKCDGYKLGRSQHYLWYRFNELPEKYKPLLNKYYK